MRSSATTVKEYLASLPADRRAGIEAVRKVILKNLDKDYEECMLWGMIGYAVPHRVWPLGYHCDPKKPLTMAALASQKNDLTVYLMSVYDGQAGTNGGVGSSAERAWFEKAWKATGKKLNMGGCCIRFKRVEDAALDVIGEAIRRMPAKKYVQNYINALASTGRGPDGKKLKAEPRSKGAANPARPSGTPAKNKGTAARASTTARAAAPKGTRADESDLTSIPGIGKTFQRDFARIGITRVSQLRRGNPDRLFARLRAANEAQNHATSKNYLYVIRMAVYYAKGGRDPEKLRWNAWKD